jgi:hypothetical protein
MQIIPVTSNPNQVIKTTLNVDGKNLSLQIGLTFNEIAGYWIMQIVNPTTNETLLDSVPLITGEYPAANLLGQHSYLKIGSAFVINVANSDLDYPDANTLGIDFVLAWGDTL